MIKQQYVVNMGKFKTSAGWYKMLYLVSTGTQVSIIYCQLCNTYEAHSTYFFQTVVGKVYWQTSNNKDHVCRIVITETKQYMYKVLWGWACLNYFVQLPNERPIILSQGI